MPEDKEKIATLKKFTKDSKLTEEDALRLGKEVSKSVARRHKLTKKEKKFVKEAKKDKEKKDFVLVEEL